MELTQAHLTIIQECSRNKDSFNRLIDLFTELTQGQSDPETIVKPKETLPSKGSLTIFVVDDSLPLVRGMERILKSAGHKVISTANSVESISLMENDVPDLAFVDVEMPGMSGGELLAAMQNHPKLKQVAVIFVTGLVSSDEEPDLNLSGAKGFLAKPYTKTRLLKVVDKILGSLPQTA